MEYPAMWELLKEEVTPKVTKPRVRKKLFGSLGADEHHARMDAEEAVETLVRRRAEMGGDDEEEWRGRFRVTLRGGKWTAEVHGLAFDCYAAYVVKNSDAERFLQLYSLTQSGSWSFRAYSDDGAFTLAKAWAHRLFLLCEVVAGGWLPRGPSFLGGGLGWLPGTSGFARAGS